MTPDPIANERAFIRALLRSPETYWDARNFVRAEMLAVPEHKIVFDAVGGLLEAGRQVTRSTLEARLPTEYGDGLPFMPLIAVLKENASDAGPALDYTDPIRENYARLKIRKAAEAALKDCRDISKSADDSRRAESEANILRSRASRSRDPDAMQSSLQEKIEAGQKAQEELDRINAAAAQTDLSGMSRGLSDSAGNFAPKCQSSDRRRHRRRGQQHPRLDRRACAHRGGSWHRRPGCHPRRLA